MLFFMSEYDKRKERQARERAADFVKCEELVRVYCDTEESSGRPPEKVNRTEVVLSIGAKLNEWRENQGLAPRSREYIFDMLNTNAHEYDPRFPQSVKRPRKGKAPAV